jgi:DNA-binding LytR/AlgR family response regulator
MESLQVLIADDEPLARERLARLLTEAGCRVLAELEDGQALVEWFAADHAPLDALFLDIQMPGLTGLEALAELAAPPMTVFVTAYKDYAIQAFEAGGMDYLLKPVFPDRLAKALERIRAQKVRRLTPREWAALLPPLPKVPVKAGDGEVFIDLQLLTHFELDDEHVFAHSAERRYQTRWSSLRDVEEAYPYAGLIRIQRNLLLRPEAVVGCKHLLGGRLRIRLPKGKELTVSRATAGQLKNRLSLA